MLKRLLFLLPILAACGGDDDDDDKTPVSEHAYVIGSQVFGSDTLSYVSVVDSLQQTTVDLGKAHEFSGSADVWVQGEAVFVADAETLKITKYKVDGLTLVEEASISFANYGLTDFGFWRNSFVSADKAYFVNGTKELVVWNPTTMVISKTIALPALPERNGLKPFAGYSDRAAQLRNGKLYQPIYWTDSTYFQYTVDSAIVVVDVASDTVAETITAPCPGLDFSSADAAGNLYFSNWIYAAGGAAVVAQPSTCAFEIPADGSAPKVAMTFKDVTDGREGAALRFLPSGKAMFSTLHDERFPANTTDPGEVTFGDNWRFWTADPAAGALGTGAAVLEAYDWNAGAPYVFDVAGTDYMLIASGDYSKTTIFAQDATGAPASSFGIDGWAFRLFQVR